MFQRLPLLRGLAIDDEIVGKCMDSKKLSNFLETVLKVFEINTTFVN